jgi:hypothetical protein
VQGFAEASGGFRAQLRVELRAEPPYVEPPYVELRAQLRAQPRAELRVEPLYAELRVKLREEPYYAIMLVFYLQLGI